MTTFASFIDGPNGRLAYRKRDGDGTGAFWLGGFRSDMLGSKAEYVDRWAEKTGSAYVRFDYSGHGESDGAFADGSIGDWMRDALAVFDAVTAGPQILIGSSMGAWIAALIALQRPQRIAGVVFIAPAPDFTEKLIWSAFSDEQRETLMRDGRLETPSDYSDEPDVITRRLIEEGRDHLIMGGPIAISAPVRILQGMQDDAVPYAHALEFARLLESKDVEVRLVKAGDHRLSTPADLQRLAQSLNALNQQAG